MDAPPGTRPARRGTAAVAGVALLLATVLGACGRVGPARDGFDLYRGLLLAGRFEVCLPPHDATGARRAAEAHLERLAEEAAARHGLDVLVRRPAEAADAGAARVWIGDADTPGARELLERLGVERNEEGFLVAERVFHRRDDALVATFEDPERPGLPLTVWYGNDLLALERSIEDLAPGWRPVLRCLRGGRPELEVDLSVRGEPREGAVRDLGTPRRRARPAERTERIGAFDVAVPADFDLDAWRGHYFDLLPAVLARVDATLGEEGAPPADLALRVHAGVEELVLATGGAAPWRLDPARPAADVLLVPRLFGGRGDARAGAAAVWARARAGEPTARWLLEAVAVEASGFWWGRPLDEWVAHLCAGDLVPPLRELVDDASPWSRHVLVPLRAVLVRHLVTSRGSGSVRSLWLGTREFQWNPKLKQGFEAALAATLATEGDGVRRRRAADRARALERGWRAGVALLPPPLASESGAADPRRAAVDYGSRAARASLAAASDLGAAAFSLELHGYVEPGLPDRAGTRPPARSVDDVQLAATVVDGRSLGLGAMLKLHLVQERSGNWAGYRGMADDEWEPYFDAYEHLVVHGALTAELAGAELLCLGSGVPLVTTTRVRGDDGLDPDVLAGKRARWDGLIARARGAFAGALTYGASWADQAYSIDFWPQLDYVGAQVFHPVRDATRPWVRRPDVEMVAMMRKNLADLAELAEGVGKPLLVTEVGFPATRYAWQEPAAAKGPPDAAAQATMLELWGQSLAEARARRPELAGFYLWSWPVDPGAPPGAAGLFSPRGRPGEAAAGRLLGAR